MPLLQEEAMEIKRRLNKEEFASFTASNGWLDSWEQTYGANGKRLCGEVDEVSTTTIQAWIKRLPGLCQDYEPRNMLYLAELGLFFKAFQIKV